MIRALSVFFVLLLVAASATAHPHINIVPSGTTAGSDLAISFYGDPLLSFVTGVGGRQELHYNGSIYTVTADTVVNGQYGGFADGMLRGAIFNFAADAAPDLNNPAGRTTPGDANNRPVGYEIVSVSRVGDSQSAQVIWRLFPASAGAPVLTPTILEGGFTRAWADTEGATDTDRSFLLPAGAHLHGSGSVPDSGFFLFTNGRGLYDITVRAIDTLGYFDTSGELTFQLSVLPEPGSLTLLGAVGMMGLIRRRRA